MKDREKIAEIVLPDGYRPKDQEEYMSPMQLAFFLKLLTDWKVQLKTEALKTVANMHEEKAVFADPTDRATLETDRNFELRTRDRERKLLNKIDETMERIKDYDYGFCEECTSPIGLRRLEARPVTNLCIDCKTKEEDMEKQSVPDNDRE